MEPSIIEAEVVLSLRDRWEAIQRIGPVLADELDQMIEDSPGEGAHRLRQLSRWFRGPADYDDALARPDVLAMCLPLIAGGPDGVTEITRSATAAAARSGFCRLMSRPISISRRLARKLTYPIILVVAGWIIWFSFCLGVAPEFETFFDEFGIELPVPTKLIFGMAGFIRQWWWLMLILPVVFLGLAWYFNRTAGNQLVSQSSWLDQKMMSARRALANWSWHLSLLLEAGVAESSAIKLAGLTSNKTWLRQLCSDWSRRSAIVNSSAASRDQSAEVPVPPFIRNDKFQLLNTALSLPDEPAKVLLLREVSNYYYERSQVSGDWWVQWLVSIIIFLIFGMIFFVILSLFMPLVAIIGGLTGGKW